jgi:3-hydroxyisobutyrate dehydrogenase-like beta-hydroxyacid dehydrogenase
MPEIGLVGIGRVGIALARRLVAAGYDVMGHDVDATREDALRDVGGEPASLEHALGCDRVLLALFDDPQVHDVLRAAHRHDATIVDTGTGDPAFARDIAADLRERGIGYVDAPLLGSSRQIGDGQAIALVGGDPQAIDRVRSLLDAIAARVVRFGPEGQGRAAKLASNLILGLNRAAFAEGLALAEALQLDAQTFADCIAHSPARAAAAQSKAPRMLARDYAPESRIRQHRKDVALIETVAARCGATVPLAHTHATLLDSAIDAGDGELDNAAIVEVFRRRASEREY